jgi:hypothetical protein
MKKVLFIYLLLCFFNFAYGTSILEVLDNTELTDKERLDAIDEAIKSKDFDINEEYKDQMPLEYALENKNIELFKLLLSGGADPKSKNSNGISVLEKLFKSNNKENRIFLKATLDQHKNEIIDEFDSSTSESLSQDYTDDITMQELWLYYVTVDPELGLIEYLLNNYGTRAFWRDVLSSDLFNGNLSRDVNDAITSFLYVDNGCLNCCDLTCGDCGKLVKCPSCDCDINFPKCSCPNCDCEMPSCPNCDCNLDIPDCDCCDCGGVDLGDCNGCDCDGLGEIVGGLCEVLGGLLKN